MQMQIRREVVTNVSTPYSILHCKVNSAHATTHYIGYIVKGD